MNTLQVTCKLMLHDTIEKILWIDFGQKELKTDHYSSEIIDFEMVEWIDFGTTIWYPNNL